MIGGYIPIVGEPQDGDVVLVGSKYLPILDVATRPRVEIGGCSVFLNALLSTGCKMYRPAAD